MQSRKVAVSLLLCSLLFSCGAAERTFDLPDPNPVKEPFFASYSGELKNSFSPERAVASIAPDDSDPIYCNAPDLSLIPDHLPSFDDPRALPSWFEEVFWADGYWYGRIFEEPPAQKPLFVYHGKKHGYHVFSLLRKKASGFGTFYSYAIGPYIFDHCNNEDSGLTGIASIFVYREVDGTIETKAKPFVDLYMDGTFSLSDVGEIYYEELAASLDDHGTHIDWFPAGYSRSNVAEWEEDYLSSWRDKATDPLKKTTWLYHTLSEAASLPAVEPQPYTLTLPKKAESFLQSEEIRLGKSFFSVGLGSYRGYEVFVALPKKGSSWPYSSDFGEWKSCYMGMLPSPFCLGEDGVVTNVRSLYEAGKLGDNHVSAIMNRAYGFQMDIVTDQPAFQKTYLANRTLAYMQVPKEGIS